MSQVMFHFNVAQPQDYACRLLRKAVRSGNQVLVLGPQAELDALDLALWQLAPSEFLPHAGAADDPWLRSRSPIVLSDRVLPDHSAGVLLNMYANVPDGTQAFARVLEVVGADAALRQAARQRWKHYQRQGHELASHDCDAQGVS